VCCLPLTHRSRYRAAMTSTAPAPVDAALTLADALQSGFAAQRAGHQRVKLPESRPATR
jgi:hypothetical protein